MESKAKFRPNPKLKILDQAREVHRYHHYAYKTEQTYTMWIERYIKFYNWKIHPRNLTSRDVERFLSDLAVRQKVAASTQRQAMNAIVFLYRDVLDIPLEGKIQAIRSKKKPNLPTVLGKEEIALFFKHIAGIHALMPKLLYGSLSSAHGVRAAAD